MKEFNGFCQRCETRAVGYTMSMFNEELICIPCSHTEQHHPGYEAARVANLEETRKGNHSFKGVGKPDDL